MQKRFHTATGHHSVPTRLSRISVPIVGIAAAAVVRWALGGVLRDQIPLLMFIIPVALAGYVGGCWSGVFTTSAAWQWERSSSSIPSRGRSFATLSHELRTPLNVMLGWIWRLRHSRTDAETLTRGLEIIERNTRAQQRLIDDLLDLSRVARGQMHVELRPLDLHAL